jgi:sterol desaturase/sphingolipid hydroxylase (fatty acid hydroxylase superfamily)
LPRLRKRRRKRVRGPLSARYAAADRAVSNLILYSIPLFLLSLWLERAWAARQAGGIRGYETKDTLASLGMGIGNVAISVLTTIGAVALWQFAFRHRVLELGTSTAWWIWLVLFLCEDFCYYWFHRSHHELRVLWAAHVTHHSSRYFNLSTALRQSWFTPFTGPVFWLPLALIGFAPERILTAQTLSLLYQFFVHTEAVARLPAPIEWFFNTPSHHRVHHGKDVPYLDRNHGGVLIIWDRCFGTFAPERAHVTYGLTHDIESFNPFHIATHEWRALARDLARSSSLREALSYLFAAPGFSADGSSLSANQLRSRQEAGE